MIGAIATFAVAAPAHAATFNVNSTADAGDADVTVPACATATGACTLRAAIDQANFDGADAIVNLPVGTYTLTGDPGDDDNETGDLDVDMNGFTLNIDGAGARSTIIEANNVDRVFDIDVDTKVSIRDVTITGGDTRVADDLADGSIGDDFLGELFDEEISDGGGIYLKGPSTGEGQSPSELTIIDSTISGNRAGNATLPEFGELNFGDGGGIHAGEETQVSITGTTIANNTALDDGGGMETDAATTSILNTTIHGNTAMEGSDGDGDGGGIEQNEGQMSVVHATIASNAASNKGGGVNLEVEEVPQDGEGGRQPDTVSPAQQQQAGPTATFRSTILASNTAPDQGPNCRADENSTIASAGTNLEGLTDCGFTGAGELQNSNPELGALANNGGQTDTRALSPTSPALHTATSEPCPLTDQRRTTRPQGPDCDIGAYERVIQADMQVAIDDSPDPVTAGQNITYTILVHNAGPDPATNARLVVTLPSGVTLQSSTIEGGGSCSGSPLTCPLGNMAIGETRVIRIVVRTSSETAAASAASVRLAQADTGGPLNAVARVSATERDPDQSNNEARAVTNLVSSAEEAEEQGPGGEGADVAGVSGSDEDLPFTGWPLAILMAAGAWMLGAGLTLRLLAASWDSA